MQMRWLRLPRLRLAWLPVWRLRWLRRLLPILGTVPLVLSDLLLDNPKKPAPHLMRGVRLFAQKHSLGAWPEGMILKQNRPAS